MVSMATLNPNGASLSCIVGGAGTGKTQLMIEHAAALLKGGTPPEDMLMFAATPDAAIKLKARLAAYAGPTADPVRVETIRSFALNVLGSEGARSFTGRDPRLLFPFEAGILMEDVKTTGIRPGRLREMLKFFYRGWTELADDDTGWLITQEERLVMDTLKGSLSLTRGLLEPEVSNLAVRYLRAHPAELLALSRPYVLVDDYQAHSLASQVLAGMLASTELWAAGDPLARNEVFESYPHVEGLSSIAASEATERHTLETPHCARAAAAAASSLLSERALGELPSLETPAGGFAVLPFKDPGDEIRGVSGEVERLIEGGIQPGDIFVAAPNKSWLKNLRAALAHKGISADVIPSAQGLSGSACDAGSCQAALAFTALALTAHPENALAWRSWCAFDEQLACSYLFSKLRERHSATGETLSALLDQLDVVPEEGRGILAGNMRHALKARERGKEIAREAASMTGSRLLEALARMVSNDDQADVPSALLQLCAPIDEESTARELYENAVRKLSAPAFSHDPQSVKIGTYEQATGLSPHAVLLSGFVNGLIPASQYFDETKFDPKQRERMRFADAGRLYALAGKAGARLIVTYFTEAPLGIAGALDLKVDRIRMRQGQRVCAVSPSIFLRDMAEGR